MIYRILCESIRENLNYFSVVTVTGPRQSGKTTLIRNMFPDMPYYSLETPDVLDMAMSDPMAFL